MINKLLQEVKNKVHILNSRYNVYKKAILLGIFYKKGDKWFNLGTNILFLRDDKDIDASEFKTIGHFLFLVKYYSVEDVMKVIEKLADRKYLKVNGYTLFYLENENEGFKYYNHELMNSKRILEEYGEKVPIDVYEIKTDYELYRMAVDKETINRMGFDDLNDLIQFTVDNFFSALLRRRKIYDHGFIKIFIPNYHVFINEVKLIDKNLVIKVKRLNGKIDLNDFALVIRYYDLQDRISPPYVLEKIKTKNKISFSADINHARVRLQYKSEISDIPYLIDEIYSDREETKLIKSKYYQTLDKNLVVLRKSLTAEDAKVFEWAILTLLNMIGFITLWPGFMGGKLKDEIDVIAIVPDYYACLLIECTTKKGDLNKKIQTIYYKYKSVKKNFPKYTILPMIVINRDSSEIPKKVKEDARAEQIIIATNEVIEKLIDSSLKGTPPMAVFKELNVWKYISM